MWRNFWDARSPEPLECGERQQSLITRNAATFRFVEEGKYRMVYGMACSPREGEPISGDTCTVQTGLPGQVIMSLSDGMGSGRSASEDSEKVIELTQRLLETGFRHDRRSNW